MLDAASPFDRPPPLFSVVVPTFNEATEEAPSTAALRTSWIGSAGGRRST